MTTLKFVKGVIVTITSLKVQQYLVELYLKSVGKQVQRDKLNLTSLLDLLTSVAPMMFLRNTIKMFYKIL